ncbi:hypothetical protein LH612_35450, partial [Klebsiella pneumoniae]|nr:hypothetical protein [Klebsiella pneumoniae]
EEDTNRLDISTLDFPAVMLAGISRTSTPHSPGRAGPLRHCPTGWPSTNTSAVWSAGWPSRSCCSRCSA